MGLPKQQPINEDNTHSGLIGYWVFIRGAENPWSLNHNLEIFNNPELKLWVSEISGKVEVLNSSGNKVTVESIFIDAIDKCMDRKQFNLDHEDAGFFIPEENCKYVNEWFELPDYVWKYGLK